LPDDEPSRAEEDEADLAAIRDRADEPTVPWEEVMAQLGV
jgi:hypothetical protein